MIVSTAKCIDQVHCLRNIVSFGRSGGEMEGLEPMFFAPDSTRSLGKDICERGLPRTRGGTKK